MTAGVCCCSQPVNQPWSASSYDWRLQKPWNIPLSQGLEQMNHWKCGFASFYDQQLGTVAAILSTPNVCFAHSSIRAIYLQTKTQQTSTVPLLKKTKKKQFESLYKTTIHFATGAWPEADVELGAHQAWYNLCFVEPSNLLIKELGSEGPSLHCDHDNMTGNTSAEFRHNNLHLGISLQGVVERTLYGLKTTKGFLIHFYS